MNKLVLAIIILIVSTNIILARDNGQYAQVDPRIKSWIEGLKDKRGVPCCATSDGFKAEEFEWDTKDSFYRVRIGTDWFEVPDRAVIDDQPNLLGFAYVWYYYDVDSDQIVIRCFLPGSGG